jgi:hypothetical protein
MTSGRNLRLWPLLLTLAATPATRAAEVDAAVLLARLARPAPEATTFVEVRYSSLLAEPLVASGELEHRADGSLVRRVEEPYRESTVLRGENVTVEREGSKPRSFSLDRAPELRGMLASFGALLRGDRATLDRYFTLTVEGTDANWRIELLPRDTRLASRLAFIHVDGSQDRARCFTLSEPDGDASVMAVGVNGRASLPGSLERGSLLAWCDGETER